MSEPPGHLINHRVEPQGSLPQGECLFRGSHSIDASLTQEVQKSHLQVLLHAASHAQPWVTLPPGDTWPCLESFLVVTTGALGFPHSSVGKESACSAGDLGSIPGLERSAGEGIGCPLQYSWASVVAQTVNDPPAMWGDLGSIPRLGRSPGEGMQFHVF